METATSDAEAEKKVEFEASEIEYASYGGEHHLPLIMSLVDHELNESYSILTYRYFVYLWPQLSFLWIFWAGPFTGAALAAFYHQFVLRAAAAEALSTFRSNPHV